MRILVTDLEKLGLSEKEAQVYLASLELGPSPVQAIAKKADVNRATTYVMIESLIQQGLMSSFQKGKKTFFTAEKPERLHRIVHHERAVVDDKEETIKRILPELNALLSAAGERPAIYFYEGLDGLDAMRETIFDSSVSTMETAISIDDLRHLLPQEHWKAHDKRLDERKIRGRTLFTSEIDFVPSGEGKGLWEYKRLPKKLFPMHGELTVYGNKISMVALRGKLVGVIIDSKEMAAMIRTLFELAWIQADSYKNKNIR